MSKSWRRGDPAWFEGRGNPLNWPEESLIPGLAKE